MRRRRGAVGRDAVLRSRPRSRTAPTRTPSCGTSRRIPASACCASRPRRRSRSRSSPTACRRPTSTRCSPRPRDRSARSTSSTRSSRSSCGGSRARSRCSSIASGDATYAVGFTGRIVRANDGGAKYPLLWKTLLYSVDYWAVVKGSPNAKEGMKMIEWITDTKPLLALADIYAVSPANKEAAANPRAVREEPRHALGARVRRALHQHRVLGRATARTSSRSSTPGSRSKRGRVTRSARVSPDGDEDQSLRGGADRAAADPRRRELRRPARWSRSTPRSAIPRSATRCRARRRRCARGTAKGCRPRTRSRRSPSELAQAQEGQSIGAACRAASTSSSSGCARCCSRRRARRRSSRRRTRTR